MSGTEGEEDQAERLQETEQDTEDGSKPTSRPQASEGAVNEATDNVQIESPPSVGENALERVDTVKDDAHQKKMADSDSPATAGATTTESKEAFKDFKTHTAEALNPVLVKPKDPEEVKRDIISVYEKGHQRDFQYPPWEQPDFGVLARVDRFGFIHSDALPPITKEERAAHEKLRSREMKWAKMIGAWDKFFGKGKKISPKLRDRTYKGIPDSWRGPAWSRFLQIEDIRQDGVYNVWGFEYIGGDIYERQELKGRLLESPDLYQIDIDINRTFRDHVAFKDRYCIKQQELFYVLASYSLYNKEVGYCQGMSGIVAQLLLYMGEEDAFWSLHALFTSPKHGMNDLFVAGFPKLLQRWELHDQMLRKKSKRLAKHLEKEGVMTSSYSSKWFMQCFQDKLPFYTVLRLWDVFMLDGYAVVSAAALAIMLIYEDKLLSMDFDGILTLLSANLENEKIDTDHLLAMTRKFMKMKGL